MFLNQSLEVIHLDRVSPGLHDVVLDNVLDSGNYRLQYDTNESRSLYNVNTLRLQWRSQRTGNNYILKSPTVY